MDPIRINDRISYIAASEDPLSADIGIIQACGETWLYDVGNGARAVAGLSGSYHVVLSHFHADHIGNIGAVRTKALYLSAETFRYVRRGTVVRDHVYEGDLHVFPLPSCHAKGSLGLEVDGTYAFVGDALYSKVKDGFYVYNAQLLKEEIAVLKTLRAPRLLVSHYQGLVREKEEVLEELSMIYSMREKNTPEIRVPREEA